MGRIVGSASAAIVAAVAGCGMIPSLVGAQTVSPAVPGRIAIAADVFDRAPPGYIIEEHFVSGVAKSYRIASGHGPQAQVVEGGEAAYKTRIVVVRPTDPARFNGTVVLEWDNVTSSADAAPDWNYLHRELTRSGYAYVAVTTQRAGLEGGGVSQSGLKPVKLADPERYGALNHPGDAFSYDIYSQAARLVRDQAPALFGPLKPKQVLGIGESQSAAFLVTYVNAVDPLARAFDGFLIHSRFRGGAQINGDFRAALTAADARVPVEAVEIRPDVRVPVLTFITETDLLSAPVANPPPPNAGFLAARQPDAPRIRTWEVPGAAHADTYTILGGLDDGHASAEVLAKAFTPMDNLFGTPLKPSINAAPQEHYVLQSALSALNAWVTTGRPPASMPMMNVTPGGSPTLVLDAVGNATGGIRTPWMDAPTARHSGFGQSEGGTLQLFGSTTPFSAAQLAQLYPGGRTEYLEKFGEALDRAIGRGVILPADRREIMEVASVMYR